MRSPEDVVPSLTEEQQKQVAEIEGQVEATLAKRPEYRYNINVSRREISEDVWEQVVANCREAGWDAEIEGAWVIIKRPRR